MAIGFGVVLLCVVITHGFFWGESQPTVQMYLDAGAIQCLHDQGLAALSAHCTSVGEPIGLTIITGMPETMLGWLFSWIPGVDAWSAHQLLNVVLDAIALGGGYLLLRRWEVPKAIALVAAGTYLVTPSLIGLNGFQYTFTGYTFLPLYLLLFLISLDAFTAGRTWRGIAILTANSWLMVFTDGYSYATGLLIIGVVGLWWVWRSRDASWPAKGWVALTFVLANATALLAYTSYINAPANPGSGLGQFRYYALDLATIVIPLPRLLWPSHVGYHPPNLGQLYGDGGNNLFNYMGIVMLGLLVWLFVTRQLRKQPEQQRLEIVPLAIASLIGLYFSLGPGLKFFSRIDPKVPVGDVPASATRFPLPGNGLLDAHIPPFNDMRADFRWSLALRFAVVFLAAYAIGLLWRRGKRVIAAILLVLAVADVVPAPRLQINVNKQNASWVKQVRSHMVEPFDQLTKPGERVLMMPSQNDFLANVMAPMAKVRTYNVGIDKSYAASRAKWPIAVKSAVDGVLSPGEADRIATALRKDADAVLISYVNLLQGGTYWPAPQRHLAELHALVASLSADPRFDVHESTDMAIVRLRS